MRACRAEHSFSVSFRPHWVLSLVCHLVIADGATGWA